MWNDVPFLILAGGLGTRIRDVSKDKPKVLVEVNGKPFLWYLLNLLKKNCVKNVILCLAYKANQIEVFLSSFNSSNMTISISYDSPTPKGCAGTANAIKTAIESFNIQGPFWVLNGDTYLDLDFQKMYDFYISKNLDYLTALCVSEGEMGDNNVIASQDGLISKYEKTYDESHRFIDGGVSILRKECFQNNSNIVALPEMFTLLVQQHLLYGFFCNKRHYHVNTPASLLETEEYFRK